MKFLINLKKQSTRKEKLIFLIYCLFLAALFLYSFTQIDLSLTFSRITFLRNLVKSFQYIGYINRPLSTILYIIVLLVLHGLYFFYLFLSRHQKISKQKIWLILIITASILTFSYNTFSYDLFNYIFDAKIITHFHQNPYIHKALDYPGDPMLSFMHWTQRVYPYGPAWLVLTVPLSFLGMQLFLPTFFLFKLLISMSYLGTLYFISKIFQKISPRYELWGLVFLGLNPLMIIECLISSHNDIVMMFFAVWSLYLLLNKKYFLSLILLLISIGIKFATGLLLPVYLLIALLQINNKKIYWVKLFFLMLFLMIAAAVMASLRTNFQPWYLVEPLVLAVFISGEYIILFPGIIISFFALLTYVPFLFLGNWDKPVPQLLGNFRLISYILSVLAVAVYFFWQKLTKRNII